MDSSAGFTVVPPGGLVGRASTAKRNPGGTPTAGRGRSGRVCRGQATQDPGGQFRGHQWAQTVAISGQFRGRLRAAFHGRRHPSDRCGRANAGRTTCSVPPSTPRSKSGPRRPGCANRPGQADAMGPRPRCTRRLGPDDGLLYLVITVRPIPRRWFSAKCATQRAEAVRPPHTDCGAETRDVRLSSKSGGNAGCAEGCRHAART